MSSSDKEYKQLKREYHILADNALEAIWVYDIKTKRFTYASPSTSRLRGFSPEETLQQPLEEFMPRESLEKANAMTELLLTRYMQGERRDEMLKGMGDYDIYCKDGSLKQVEVTVRFITDEETGAMEILGVSRDVTERKQLEKQLRQLTEELNQKNMILNELVTRDALTGLFNR